jgi:hypothetical protein
MVLETDPYGNMFLTGSNHTTARDWARLGLRPQTMLWNRCLRSSIMSRR